MRTVSIINRSTCAHNWERSNQIQDDVAHLYSMNGEVRVVRSLHRVGAMHVTHLSRAIELVKVAKPVSVGRVSGIAPQFDGDTHLGWKWRLGIVPCRRDVG